MRRKLFYVWTLCLLILVLGSVPVYAKKAVMTYQEKTMYVGKTATFKIDGKRKEAKWTSSKKSVATVNKGKVKAKKPGKCTIKAVLKNKTFIFKLTVKKKSTASESDSDMIPVDLKVYYNARDYSTGILKGYDANKKNISVLLVYPYGWSVDTGYKSENDTYTIKINFSMTKYLGPRLWRTHRNSPCYFAWECYNSDADLVKSGVYSTGPAVYRQQFTGPLLITDLKKDGYMVKISDYYQK